MTKNNEPISFNVTKSIWRLNRSANGWQKEVNLVAWNGKKPKLDVREWNADKTKMRRGVTFNKEEAFELKRCLNSLDIAWLYEAPDDETAPEANPGPVGGESAGRDTATVPFAEETPTESPSPDPEEDE